MVSDFRSDRRIGTHATPLGLAPDEDLQLEHRPPQRTPSAIVVPDRHAGDVPR